MPLVWDLTKELTRWLTPEKLRTLNGSWRSQGGGHPDSQKQTGHTSYVPGGGSESEREPQHGHL